MSRLIYVTDWISITFWLGVFQIAKLAKWIPKIVIEHVLLSVQGEDGKKLKTRSGETIRLVDLLDEAIQRAKADLEDRLKLKADQKRKAFIDRVSTTVEIAAIKYADLSQNRVSNYQFSFDKMLFLEGIPSIFAVCISSNCRYIAQRGDLNVSVRIFCSMKHKNGFDSSSYNLIV